ncbi:helix-turn-helix transcriptional regulator [Burkholderia cenocepacia]|nr:helix-turn-helix transcriptional regulator [Burkholderia cenocepacia]MBR8030274.1 helix-turn-helix transcriptional regulator [Burkholderia cenocepacia]MBR8174088.1 helix-turn-helix transcriptional regulator [Burkholderia cenocepacia]MBR8428795.1 helix-turn-helix transcriptional regulator [Burkholderia cenocepacia]MBU9660044.1 helix-turn-helix transcriptional regulator [Burkholderia cenocepacia]
MSFTTRLEEFRAISDLVSTLGDKWSMHVLFLLEDGPMRFSVLRGRIGDVSHRMLTVTLRGLERDGLVTRVVFPVIPPKVQYALTPLAYSLIAALSPLRSWVVEHHGRVTASRAKYDERKEPDEDS